MNTNRIQHARIRRAFSAARSCAPKIEWLEARQLLSTYTVNSLSDALNPGAGVLTLRQAVAAANAHAGADTINFAATLFPGTTLQTLTLQQGEIDFTDAGGATTVSGPGAAKLAISGNNASRIFGVSAGVTVSLSGTTLTGGNAKTMSADGNYRGGAIENHGTLTINSSTISGNSAGGPGVSYGYGYGTLPFSIMGGAVYSTGPLTVQSSTFSSNGDKTDFASNVDLMGGAIYSTGPLTVQSSTFSSNSAKADFVGSHALGGAIYCTAALKITASTLSGNAVEAGLGHDHDNMASGGAIFVNGVLTIDSSNLSGNSATGLGGSGSGEGGAITAGSTTTISATTISGNHAGSGSDLYGDARSYGGGILCSGNLTITSSKILGNSVSAGYTEPGQKPAGGGGISCGSLTLVNSEVSGNGVSGSPGGASFAGGGGILVGGALSISGSSITNNGVTGSTSGDSGSGADGCGGGILAGGAAQISTTTITGNTAVGGNGTPNPWTWGYSGGSGGGGLGGGVFVGGPLTLTNCTISKNNAVGGAGGNASHDTYKPGGPGGNGMGGGVYANSTFTLVDSTVSGNTVAGGEAGWGFKHDQQYHYYYAQADPGKGIAPNISASGVSVEIQAKTSGPYSVNAGSTLQLDASKSVAPTGSAFSWDVNGDKVYGDATGITPKLTWAQLTALKLHDGVFTASVRITAGSVTAIATTTLTVHTATVAQVSGTVFNDLNANGNPETTEPKVAGRTVYLDANNNTKLDVGEVKTVTNSSGKFTFANLKPGTYRIREVLPAGWRQTAPNGNTAARVVTLLAGQNVTVMQIGATQAAVITGKFYNDLNSNGVFDSTEKGLSYWQVYNDKNNNGIWDKGEYIVTADSKGNYTMVLKPGTYRLREVRLNGWMRTQPPGAWPGGYYDVTVGAGQLVTGRNFGNHQ